MSVTRCANSVFVLSERKPAYVALLVEQGIELCELESNAEIVLADPPLLAKQIHLFPQLKWIQSTFAGVDRLASQPVPEGCQLTGVKGIFGPLIAEYVFAHGLRFSRHLDRYAQQQRDHVWQPLGLVPLSQQNIVVLGTGSIGQYVAKVARSLGMKAVGFNTGGTNAPAFDDVVSVDNLSGALADASWVVNTLPHTPSTEGLLDSSTLKNCSQALFFNVGRASIVNQTDLLAALDLGCVSHAFLDVFDLEPLPEDSPLWSHPQVTVTPHIAAPSLPEDVFNVFFENYQKYLQNQPLSHLIDLTKGY